MVKTSMTADIAASAISVCTSDCPFEFLTGELMSYLIGKFEKYLDHFRMRFLKFFGKNFFGNFPKFFLFARDHEARHAKELLRAHGFLWGLNGYRELRTFEVRSQKVNVKLLNR